jgi:hypothetical protein
MKRRLENRLRVSNHQIIRRAFFHGAKGCIKSAEYENKSPSPEFVGFLVARLFGSDSARVIFSRGYEAATRV